MCRSQVCGDLSPGRHDNTLKGSAKGGGVVCRISTIIEKGPSISYVRIFTCYLDPLPPFLHVILNGNV